MVILRSALLITLVTLSSFASVSHAERDVQLLGDFEQGSLVRGVVPLGSTVRHDEQAVRVSEQGDFLIGFGRDSAGESRLEIKLPDGEILNRVMQIRPRSYKVERVDGLPPAKVSPKSPEVLARIRAEINAAKKARRLDAERTDFLEGFNWPLIGPITGVYGSQRVLNGQPKRPHYGVDIAAPAGTLVVAPASGLVTLVHPDMYYSGGTMILDHGHGLSSSFLHLKKVLVSQGQRVQKGEVIAEVGSGGRSTGAHLDWRVNLFIKRLDAARLVGPMPMTAKTSGK